MLALMGLSAFLPACTDEQSWKGNVLGQNHKVGHLLRDKQIGDVAITEHKKVVIVGGGISALSAARQLARQGLDDVLLLELEDHIGGNASLGENEISKFPLGAHYVPVANNNLTEYLSFLEESGIIEAYSEDGLPVYKEDYLCNDPEERLYINGRWQEGLIPQYGISESDREELKRFFSMMDKFREAKGKDGRDAFAIPVDMSSDDEEYASLDGLTMRDWLNGQHFSSPYLYWYVNYCTLDDYGTPLDAISAWVAIHYYASRKGRAANASRHDVLTWEEGNGFLMKQLAKQSACEKRTNTLVLAIDTLEKGVKLSCLNTTTGVFYAIKADQCILATPQFVNGRMMRFLPERQEIVVKSMDYVPWMVANFTVGNTLIDRSGISMSWDNVIYGGTGLGYVDATHQQMRSFRAKRNLTYYKPLYADDLRMARRSAIDKTHKDWVEEMVADLKLVHPNIATAIERIDIMLWGHAMLCPRPSWIKGRLRKQLQESVNDVIHFAHTDLAGVSIFEEAFYQGIKAADKVLDKLL